MATITKRGNSFNIRVSAGYDLSGKQIRKNLTWSPLPGMTAKQIEKELNIQAMKFEEKVQSGIVINGSIKFSEFADKWMEDYARTQLTVKTSHEYQKLLKRIKQSLGHIPLNRIQPNHLISFYNNLSEGGIKENRSYTAKEEFFNFINSKKINTSHLVDNAGVSKGTAFNMMKGKPVSFESSQKVCSFLKVEISDFFEPVSDNSKLSSNTILHYHRIISTMLKTAVYWQIITSNPAERVKAPKLIKNESTYLDEPQTKKLITLIEKEPINYKTMIILLIYTGLRRGELLGLKWSDINFKDNVLNVKRSIQYIPKIGLFEKEPKNKSSVRAIKLPEIAVKLLHDYRKFQNIERLKLGELWQKETDLLFTRWDGSYFNPDDLTKWYRNFVKNNNLSESSIHSLRHTNASLMIASGVNIRTVSARLGHAQTSTTSNIYAHAIKSADEAAAQAMDDIFSTGQYANK